MSTTYKTVLPITEVPSQEQKNSIRESIVTVAGYQSTQAQIEAYKAGANDNNTLLYSDTASYIQNYNDFASNIRRANAINTYIENGALFGAS